MGRKIEEKIAVVTGGTSGIGLAAAIKSPRSTSTTLTRTLSLTKSPTRRWRWLVARGWADNQLFCIPIAMAVLLVALATVKYVTDRHFEA